MSEQPAPSHTKIMQSFKRSLNGYHQSAVVQADIAKTLMDHFLTASGQQKLSHVFEFGCSTGHLTEQLMSRLNIDHLTANDLIKESRHFISSMLDDASQNWHFEAGAIENLDLPDNLDLIASSSTMQWIFDTAALLDKLTRALKPGGWLMLSTFADNHFQELQIMGSKARATRYTNAEDWAKLIPPDLTIKHSQGEDIKIHFPSARAMLSHLRQTGVNGNAGQAWGRQKLLEFEAAYEEQFKDDEGIFLTYAPVYIIAQKQS